MNDWTPALISSFFLGGAIVLMFAQVRSWRALQSRSCNAAELDFRRRQFRLRMQSCVLLGLLAVALFVGDVVNSRIESQWFKAIYWGGVLLLVVWMGLSAAADMLATRHYYSPLQDSNMIEQAKLRAELRRLQAKEGNGKKEDEG